MSDRTTLMKIASTPYSKNRYGWKLDAFRIGNTLLICPQSIDEEQQHYNSSNGLKGVYRLEMVKNAITQVSKSMVHISAPVINTYRDSTAMMTKSTLRAPTTA